MRKKVQAGAAKLLSMVLAAAMMLAFIPAGAGEETGPSAAFEKSRDNTGLGTSLLSNPNKDAPWSGNYVYFGKYSGHPIRFRVLEKDATAYTTGKALFLDSDEILFVDYFDNTEPYSNAWEDSDIRALLNGPFLDGFSTPEQAAVATSIGDGGRPYPPDAPETPVFGAPVPVNDHVFLLDVADMTNEVYGYAPGPGWKYIFLPGPGVPGHIKCGAFTYWWLRTAAKDSRIDAGVVNCSGNLNTVGVNCYMGVAPAVNIDQEAILFATAVETDPAAFKLTVIDSLLTIAVPDGRQASVENTTVSIPWEIGGADAEETTRVSVLILDRAYSAGNENGAVILCYHALGEDGTFDLPAGCDLGGWGSDYDVYLLAENTHGLYETDYASVPVPVDPPQTVFRTAE